MADGFAFSSAPSPEELAAFDLNHLGNAMRLARLAGAAVVDNGELEVDATHATLVFVPGVGWVGYSRRRGFWDRENGKAVAQRLTHAVARQVRALAGFWIETGAHGSARDVMKFVDGCGNTAASNGMLAMGETYLTVGLDAFDRDPWVINCRNGTLALRDAEERFAPKLRPHDPADRITRQAGCDWRPEAEAPLFHRVLNHSLPKAAARSGFQRWMGYASTGLTHEQSLVLTQGKGNDGKSTLLDAAREALGSYGAVGNVLTFLDTGPTSGTQADPELVKLAGDVRLVILSEPKRGQQLNEGRLKAWTSGSPISARDLYQGSTTFRPIGKLTMECNELPVVKGADDGIWRRILTPIFRHQVPAHEVDKTLQARIRDGELEGVLAWLVAGVGDWMARGLDPPPEWSEAKDEYRKSQNPIAEWLNESCIWGDQAKGCEMPAKELYGNFKLWFDDQGYDNPPKQKSFGDFLRGKQIGVRKSHGVSIRKSIRLKTPEERELDEAGASVDLASAGGRSEVEETWHDPVLDTGFELPADGEDQL